LSGALARLVYNQFLPQLVELNLVPVTLDVEIQLQYIIRVLELVYYVQLFKVLRSNERREVRVYLRIAESTLVLHIEQILGHDEHNGFVADFEVHDVLDSLHRQFLVIRFVEHQFAVSEPFFGETVEDGFVVDGLGEFRLELLCEVD